MTDKLNEGDVPSGYIWPTKDIWDAYVKCINAELKSYDELVDKIGIDFTNVDFSSYKAIRDTISPKT